MPAAVVDKQAKKKQILDAAMTVFAEKGYRNAKMADVAEAAGVGKGTIYEYFRSREDLFLQLFESTKWEPLGFLFQGDTLEADPANRLERLIVSSVKAYPQLESSIRLFTDFMAEYRTRDAEGAGKSRLGVMYDDFRRQVSSIVKEGIEKGSFKEVDADYAAAVIVGAIEGLMLQWLHDPKAFSLEKMASVLADATLAYLRA